MRASKILVATAMTAAIFALGACSNSDEPEVVDLTKPIDIQASVSSVDTRALPGATGFASSDAIGVYVNAGGSQDLGSAGQDSKNVQYTFNASAWSAYNGKPAYWQQVGDNYVTAYYPYASTVPGGYALPVTVGKDQSLIANYTKCDYMFYGGSVTATNSALSFAMAHKMASIKVTLTAGDGVTESELAAMTNVRLNGTEYFDGTMALTNGGVIAKGSEESAADITPYKHTDGAYYFIILPGTEYAASTALFTIWNPSDENTKFVYKPTGKFSVAAGNEYSFALKVNKGTISLSGITISPWSPQTGDNNGDANMEVTSSQP